jgi:hypothetical protein
VGKIEVKMKGQTQRETQRMGKVKGLQIFRERFSPFGVESFYV